MNIITITDKGLLRFSLGCLFLGFGLLLAIFILGSIEDGGLHLIASLYQLFIEADPLVPIKEDTFPNFVVE